MFYTNDVSDTPKQPICQPDEHSVLCVHGMTKIRRWLGHETMHPTLIEVPSIVFA